MYSGSCTNEDLLYLSKLFHQSVNNVLLAYCLRKRLNNNQALFRLNFKARNVFLINASRALNFCLSLFSEVLKHTYDKNVSKRPPFFVTKGKLL